MDELVLPGAPGHDARVLARWTFDEHFLDTTDPLAVTGESAAFDDDFQPVEPLTGDCRLDEMMVHRRRLGARPGREDEREREVEACFGRQLERLAKVGLASRRGSQR